MSSTMGNLQLGGSDSLVHSGPGRGWFGTTGHDTDSYTHPVPVLTRCRQGRRGRPRRDAERAPPPRRCFPYVTPIAPAMLSPDRFAKVGTVQSTTRLSGRL